MPTGTPQVVVAEPSAKPWWKSKIILFNLASVVLAAAEASFGLLQPQVPVNVYAVIAFAMAVVNAGLRFVTSQAVALRSPKPEEGAK
jgi:hypothetical protein